MLTRREQPVTDLVMLPMPRTVREQGDLGLVAEYEQRLPHDEDDDCEA